MARGRGRARTAPGRLEKQILKNARHLKEHPELVAPQCSGPCPRKCPYARARADVERVHAARDDPAQLVKLSQGGGIFSRTAQIAMGYAALLKVLDEGGIDFLQNTGTPAGMVAILPRGKAGSGVHAGLQHFHDPKLRLLSAVGEVPRGATLYVTDDGLLCAHDGTPPEGFVDKALAELPVQRVSPNVARCRHVTDDWTSTAYLELDWHAASLRLRVCHECSSGNTFARLLRRAANPDPASAVSVRVQLPRLVDPAGGDVPDAQPQLAAHDVDLYLKGRMSDADLFERARVSRQAQLEGHAEPFVVVGDEAYRPRDSALLDALDGPDAWRPGIQAAMRELARTVVLAKPSATALLAEVWSDHGEAALDAVGGAGTADELFDPSADKEAVSNAMDRAATRARRRSVDEALPAYKSVPSPADLVDEVVRARRAHGDDAAVRRLQQEAKSGRRGAVAHAMLELLGRPGHEYALTHLDRELAELLSPYLEAVMEAEPDAYDEALGNVLAACGIAERPERA